MKNGYSVVFAALLAAGAAQAADVEVKSGAVGIDERQEFMKTFGNYNLHLAFAEKSGAYLADVDVTIRDAQGKVLWSGTADGPLFFARVPSGRYSVEAQFAGDTKRRSIQVGDGPGRMHYMHWDPAGVTQRAASAGR